MRPFVAFLVVFFGLSLSLPSRSVPADEGEGARFRKLFAALEEKGGLEKLMDRSQWPENDRLTSYLEYELLYHPEYQTSVRRLALFLRRWPDHPRIDEVRRFMEVRVTETSDDREALGWYDRFEPKIRSSQFRYLQLLLDFHRKKEAQSLWRILYRQGVTFPRPIEQETQNFFDTLSLSDHESRARRFLLAKKEKEMRGMFRWLPRQTQLYLLTLEAANQAELKFYGLVKKLDKTHATAPELWLARINGLQRFGFRKKAMDLVMGKEGNYLSAKDRQYWRYRLARIFALHGETKTAVKLLKPNIQEMGSRLEDSLWLLAWYTYQNGDHKEARNHFMLLGREARSADRRSQGAYWAAQTAPNEKERQYWLTIGANYPQSFYGLLCAEESQGFLKAFPKESPPCPPMTEEKYREELALLQLFVGAGRNYYIGPEIERIAKRFHLSTTDQLCLAMRFNAPSHVIKMANTLKNQGKTYWDGLYPVPDWQPHVGWQVDPSLIWGMARQESMFFHRAQSSANAHGLLQLLPSTARQEARDSGFLPSNTFRLKNPAYNLSVGQSYIRRMLKRFDGDIVLALAAYNAGPSRSERWRAQRQKEDPLTFIENIPFTETRHYVKRVIRGWVIYQLRLYGAASLQSTLVAGQPGVNALVMVDSDG